MEIILANTSGKVRRETLNGRSYLVAPAKLLPGNGILHGSKGRLFYPMEEVNKNPWAWNGMPLIHRHPTDKDGKNISGRNPSVLNSHGLGYFFNAVANGDLGGEAWFDEENTKTLDKTLPVSNRIVPKLENGEPIELSTGLFTEDTKAPNGSNHNGKPYDYIARNYGPDHIAILTDQKGACSVKDGCGIHVNNEDVVDNGGPGSGPQPGGGSSNGDGKEDITSSWGDKKELLKEMKAEGGRSSKASNQSAKAEKSGSLSDHLLASQLHLSAASGAFARGKEELGQKHLAMTQYHQQTPKSTNNIENKSVVQKFWDWLTDNGGSERVCECAEGESCDKCIGTNAGKYGNPSSVATGKFKKYGAGTGAGDVHEAAQFGSFSPTEKDKELGDQVASGLVSASSENLWEKAKAAAEKGGHVEDWAYVAGIYTRMGGMVESVTEAVSEDVTIETLNGGPGSGPNPGGGSSTEIPQSEKTSLMKTVQDAKSTGFAFAHSPEHLAFIKEKLSASGYKVSTKTSKSGDKTKYQLTVTKNALESTSNNGDIVMNKEQTVAYLTTNCDCWKGEEKTLNLMSDEQLKKLKANTDKTKTLELTANAFTEVAKTVGAPSEMKVNDLPAFIKEKMKNKEDPEDDEEEDDEDAKCKEKGYTKNKKKTTTNVVTDEQWLKNAPPNIRSAVTNAMVIEKQEREKLIKRLTANVRSEEKLKQVYNRLKDKDLAELKDLVSLLPPVHNAREVDEDEPLPSYLGRDGGEVTVNDNDDDDPPLMAPVTNWEEIIANRRKASVT